MANLIIKQPKRVLLVTGIITVIMLFFAMNLTMELSWLGLFPQQNPAVKPYNQILHQYEAASQIYVTVETENRENPESFIPVIVHRLQQYPQYIKSIQGKMDNQFAVKWGLVLSKTDRIDQIQDLLRDPNLTGYLKNLNELFEKEYSGSSEHIQDDQRMLQSSLWGINYFIQDIQPENNAENMKEAANRLLVGDPYLRSIDGKTILLQIQPNYSMFDYLELTQGTNVIEGVLNQLEKENPELKLGLTGMHVVGRDEMVVSERDSMITMIVAAILILIIMFVAFKMWLAPFISAVPLVVGIIWAMGIAGILVGRLNLMTVFVAAILIGLGIDFSIHIFSGYTEAQNEGKNPEEAICYSLEIIGPGILTGGLTTSLAFFVLVLSSMEFVEELGIIMGFGLLTTMLAVFLILPALLYLHDRKKGIQTRSVSGKYEWIGNLAVWSKKTRFIILPLLIIILIGAISIGRGFDFIMDIKKLEAKNLESTRVMDEIVDKFNMSNDGLFFSDNDLSTIHTITEKVKDEILVERVDSITDYLPPLAIQQKRLDRIKEFNRIIDNPKSFSPLQKEELMKQLERLQDNLIEMGQLSFMSGVDEIVSASDAIIGTEKEAGSLPVLIQNIKELPDDSPYLSLLSAQFYRMTGQLIDRMKVERMITKDDLPENIKNMFISKDGRNYLTTFYYQGNVWNDIKTKRADRFFELASSSHPAVTGMPLIMKALYDIGKKQLSEAFLLIGLTILIILLLHFRSLRQALIAFIPLISAIILTLGVVVLFDVQFDMVSIFALPLIIGIGIDDGVHVIHRLNTSKESLKNIFSSVGRAILLTSLTTMASFGSLMLAQYQGIFRFGFTLFFGIAFCFLMTVFLIPIFIRRNNRKENTHQNSGKEKNRKE